ncbi:uncharacterized protein [Spinacia oleracea]|uniref:Uncharacterized protein isoform X1 n=1 Tax=Spinacia oleracea TaxID=3562 RepID=A0A9R0J547_SPIOL|nr:uncharacterized protein LOC110800562 isoform X1 [Spinacia oleracea]
MTNAFDNLEECFLKYNHEWPFLLGAQFSAALDTIEAFRQIKWDDELSIKIFNRRNLYFSDCQFPSYEEQIDEVRIEWVRHVVQQLYNHLVMLKEPTYIRLLINVFYVV